MTPSLEQLGIDGLTAEERLALAQEILDSVIADRPPPPLSPTKREELRRRIAEHEANPEDVVPWEQVRAAAAERFSP